MVLLPIGSPCCQRAVQKKCYFYFYFYFTLMRTLLREAIIISFSKLYFDNFVWWESTNKAFKEMLVFWDGFKSKLNHSCTVL